LIPTESLITSFANDDKATVDNAQERTVFRADFGLYPITDESSLIFNI
jgi:hypothetical protein